MFRGTIAALKATEVAAQAELDALYVPYDVATGSGGTHWHAAGSSILTAAILGVGTLRADLEKRQANIDAGEALNTPASKGSKVAAAQATADAAQAALKAAQALPDDVAGPTPKVDAIAEANQEVADAAAAQSAAQTTLTQAQAQVPPDPATVAAAHGAVDLANTDKAQADAALVAANALPADPIPGPAPVGPKAQAVAKATADKATADAALAAAQAALPTDQAALDKATTDEAAASQALADANALPADHAPAVVTNG
jgi:trimeric autotransporter adhesin